MGAQQSQFDVLMAEQGAAISRVAASYEANPHMAEELAQEMALAIWQALGSFRGDSSLRTFAFKIAHNRGISHGLKHAKEPKNQSDIEALSTDATNPQQQTEKNRQHQKLQAAVRALPLAQRQLVTLALEGFSYQEISEVVGITSTNVGVRLNRAKKQLEETLNA